MYRNVQLFFINQFFNSNSTSKVTLNFLAFSFPLFTLFALWIDSVLFKQLFFDGRWLTNVLAIIYFIGFLFASPSYLRKLMIVMVFLSYIGELIFCKLLGMYAYRTNDIPLYVPFGHAIVYASGFVLAKTNLFSIYSDFLRKLFFIVYGLLFLGVGIFLHDVFTLLFGLLFFILLKRKKWDNLYYSIALCVIFIELVGTYFRCWTWVPKTFDLIPAANPPMGAVFFYAGGDVLLAKIVSYWKN
jgi:hypothetical protein